jgi:hypothetical protein
LPIEWKAQQVWSEVIASRFGEHLGVPVPRCFLGRDTEGRIGALIEFFYGYPGQVDVPRFVHASDLLRTTIDNPKVGKPHSLRLNVIVCRLLRIAEPVVWWAKTLAFDALIGNTDRHPDNWGFLAFRLPNRQQRHEMAPAFDNGTSLGYELRDGALLPPWNASRISAYIGRGTHHCGWNRSDRKPIQHAELCRIFARAYPEAGIMMRQMLDFDPMRIGDTLRECSDTVITPSFTEARARWVVALIESRASLLRKVLGG